MPLIGGIRKGFVGQGLTTLQILSILPRSYIVAQQPQNVHGIGNGVPFFWCSAVVLGKYGQPTPCVFVEFQLLLVCRPTRQVGNRPKDIRA
jgi:hypothetical protein